MILKATLHHLHLLVPLFNQYRIFYNQPSDEIACEDFLRERFEKNEAHFFICFDVDDNIKAVGFATLFPSFSSVGLRKIFILNDLYVNENNRRSGTGRRLIEAAAAFAKENGAIRLVLETAKDNHTAQQLYHKMNFKRADDFYFYSLEI